MKKLILMLIISVLLTAFIFSGCSPAEFYSGTLSNQSGQAGDSVLADYLSTSPLLPVSGLTAGVVNTDGVNSVRLTWDPIPYAGRYIVYSSASEDGEYAIAGSTISADYSFSVAFADGETEKDFFFKVATVNVNEVESAFSNAISLTVSRTGENNSQVVLCYLSRGTSDAVIVNWSSVVNTSYYKILRVLSGADLSTAVTVDASYLPLNKDLAMQAYPDATIENGILYDYWIIPVDSTGAEGSLSLKATAGYARPVPFDFTVSQGHALRSVVGTPYCLIELTWSAKYQLEDAFGPILNPVEDPNKYEVIQIPDRWDVVCAYTPSTGVFYDLADVYNVAFGGSVELTVLEDISTEGFVEDGITMTADPENPVDNEWVREGSLFTSIDSTLNQVNYIYRLYAVNDDFSPGNAEFTETWTQSFFFKTQAVFNQNKTNEFKTAFSPLLKGYAVDPSAIDPPSAAATVSMEQIDIDTVLTDTIRVEWTASAGALQYLIYRKVVGSDGWSMLSVASDLFYNDATAEGSVQYQYGIAATSVADDLTLQSEMSLQSDPFGL